MTERGSLKPQIKIVNQGAALGLILFLAACGSGDEKTVSEAPASIKAPIIWQTSSIDNSFSAMASLEGGMPRFLISGEAGGIRLYDADGISLTETGPYKTSSIGTGTVTDIDGAVLTVFPAISRNNDKIVTFVYGQGMVAPSEIELEATISGRIQGICSAPAGYADAILNIAYWTDLDPTILIRGRIRNEGLNLIFDEVDRLSFDKYLTSCDLDEDTVAAGGGFGLEFRDGENSATPIDLPGVPTKLAVLKTQDETLAAASFSGGQVYIANDKGQFSRIEFVAGLSSEVPDEAVHIALSDNTGIGSFPDGFMAVESRREGADTQIVYVDRKALSDQLKGLGE